MPTILRLFGWRFYFYSDEGTEPPHIHIATYGGECKYWLSPVRLDKSENVKPSDMRKIEITLMENENFILEKWNEYFTN
jgi:Domain of unknown function (DUF4160)